MDQNAERFNESQLRRSGFAEAFTPELKQKMADGVPVIEHKFGKKFEEDTVEATLHLKKSASSDFYFLNKFELQLQKEGQKDPVKQTFFITRNKETNQTDGDQPLKQHENRYTLKESYNLLSGRPVHKNLSNKEGQEYEAWVKIDFKNKLDNGNFEMKQYHKNYGFELENVLSKYPIKELATPQYKANLIESLQRGNLQKVTFVGQGGTEEKLYISPSIALGALNVYDLSKQRLPTEKLVEKDFIGKELAADLTKRIGQENKNEQKQEVQPSQDQKQANKQKQNAKAGDDDAKKKQVKKQKIK